jgi:hypothetical protein
LDCFFVVLKCRVRELFRTFRFSRFLHVSFFKSSTFRFAGFTPDIDCVVKFKSEDGKLHEEHRPLLRLAHPNDDYSHHEVQKIVSLDDEYGNRSYVFFLSAKVGSNEYAHDIVVFEIAGDSLRPLYNFKID